MKLLFASILLILSGGTVMADDMKIYINDSEYVLSIDDNETARNIFENIDGTISLTKYAGHEYTTALGFDVAADEKQTSELLAGHIYYWAPGNALVINYVDYDIAPYSSIHIGEFTDKSVCDLLQNANDEITLSKGKTNE